MPDLITKTQLQTIMPVAKPENIEKYYAPLLQCFAHYEIETPLRLAHFIAQVAQESGSLKFSEEIWPNPTLDANGVATKGSAWQLRYEGRTELGNTRAGDGYKFRGRGLIQLTGRTNYAKFGAFLGRDLVSGDFPNLVAQPELSVNAAGWFWNSRNLSAFADKDDLLSITKRINGGSLGIENRRAYLESSKKALGIT